MRQQFSCSSADDAIAPLAAKAATAIAAEQCARRPPPGFREMHPPGQCTLPRGLGIRVSAFVGGAHVATSFGQRSCRR